MEEKKFKEIIQFAIDKEIQAFKFYTGVSQSAKYSGAKELFLELAKEEEGHQKLLENFSIEKVAEAKIKPIPDLKVSDYMTEVEFRPDMPYADILRMAPSLSPSRGRAREGVNLNSDRRLSLLCYVLIFFER
ncbi:MAG: ferritin family protein [Thermodesulfobacteriota bacterium]